MQAGRPPIDITGGEGVVPNVQIPRTKDETPECAVHVSLTTVMALLALILVTNALAMTLVR